MLLLWLGRYACDFGELQCNGSAKISKSQCSMIWSIHTLQFNKIRTGAGRTSIASKRFTLEATICICATTYFEHKRFSCMIRSYNMRFRNGEQLLVWVCCSYYGGTSCRTSCNSFCLDRCIGKDAISYNSQQPCCIHQYHCRMNIPLITILGRRFCDK
jgi:hypothetical protein